MNYVIVIMVKKKQEESELFVLWFVAKKYLNWIEY